MTLKRLIEMALQTLGVLGEGMEASPEAIIDGMDYLNSMIGSWMNESLLIPYVSRETFTMPAQQEITIGPGLDLDTDAPDEIVRVIIYFGGKAHNVMFVPEGTIKILTVETDTVPRMFTFVVTQDAVSLLFSSIAPDSCTIELHSLKPIVSFDDLTEETALPSGYDQLIYNSLAVIMAPKFGKTVRQDVAAFAADAMNKLKHKRAVERPPEEMTMPSGYPGMSRQHFNIMQ